jgi:hypothetical protein
MQQPQQYQRENDKHAADNWHHRSQSGALHSQFERDSFRSADILSHFELMTIQNGIGPLEKMVPMERRSGERVRP